MTRTYCDEAGDNAVPNVLSPRDIAFRPDLRTKKQTVQHTFKSGNRPGTLQMGLNFDLIGLG